MPTQGGRAELDPTGPRASQTRKRYLWPRRCCWSGSGPAYRGPDRRFCCGCRQPQRAPRCGVPHSRAWQIGVVLRGLGNDGWTRIPARRGVTVRAQRLHEPSRKRRRLREEESSGKGSCLAARCWRDVEGCPPRARRGNVPGNSRLAGMVTSGAKGSETRPLRDGFLRARKDNTLF